MLQEIQQQGEIEAQSRSRRAGSQKRRITRPTPSPLQASKHISSKSGLSSSSSSPLSSHSESLPLPVEPIQQRTSSDTARDRNGQKSKAILSPFERRSDSGGAWWLPPTQKGTQELMGRCPQTSASINGLQHSSTGTTEPERISTPDNETLASLTSKDSNESQVSSIAYFTHDRRKDFRLLIVPSIVSKNKALIELEKDILGKPKDVKSPSRPIIVEDSQDHITAKASAMARLTRNLELSRSTSDVPLSESSSVYINRRAKSVTGVRGGSANALTLTQQSHKRPILSRFHTSNSTVSNSFPRPTTAPASPRRRPRLPQDSLSRRQTASGRLTRVDTRSFPGLPRRPRQDRTVPSFQPDEKYFEDIASSEQQSFNITDTTDPVVQSTIQDFRPPTILIRTSPFTSPATSGRASGSQKRKCRCCFRTPNWLPWANR